MRIFWSIALGLLAFCLQAQEKTYRRTLLLMSSRFDVSVVASNQKQADLYMNAAIEEIKRIENIISEWKPDSETSNINRYAGIKPVRVSSELFDLIDRSLKISKITQGAFDISFASIDAIWKFDGSMTKMPTEEQVQKSVALIGYQNILLDAGAQTVFLKSVGMKIGFGGIGQGYAADRTRDLLIKMGCKSGIINVSGDICVWGKQPNGKPWQVGITNPLNPKKIINWFDLDQSQTVTTSGNYEKYVEFNGKHFGHIINPKTGWPAQGLKSVSVFAPKTEMADALATAVFVMGKDKGLAFVEELQGVECLIIDDQNKIWTSSGLKKQIIPL